MRERDIPTCDQLRAEIKRYADQLADGTDTDTTPGAVAARLRMILIGYRWGDQHV